MVAAELTSLGWVASLSLRRGEDVLAFICGCFHRLTDQLVLLCLHSDRHDGVLIQLPAADYALLR